MAPGLARKEFEGCVAQLKDLQRGRYITPDFPEYDDSPGTPFNTLTERLRHTLSATTFAEDLEWWLGSSFGRKTYWQLNRQAMTRGVTIERIIIYDAWTDEVEAFAAEQHESGVRVMRVTRDFLPTSLRLNLVIWDGQCGYEPRSNPAGEYMGQSFTFAAQDLASMQARFNAIKSCAEPWP